jgi:hypothetical protein
LTPKRPRRQVENDECAAFVRRVLRAYARRVGDGDVEALVLMANLADEIDTAIAEAVKGLRGCGYSWAEIGARLGITRQAAQQRWGANSSQHGRIAPEPAADNAWLSALDAYSVIFTNPCWTSWVILAPASVLTLIPGIRSSFP